MPTAASPAQSSPVAPPPAADLFAKYQGRADRYDECRAPDGTLRPAWREFLGLLGADPAASLRAASDACRRAVLEHEVNMNVYAGAHSDARPWPLDAVPLLLDAESWTSLAAGLRQRAHLFNALLKDLYGPQRLLKQHSIPPVLALANPHFLRPCAGLGRQQGPFLHTYAADVARSPDGRWWVLEDRLDAPSGLGYSLQNRILVRQVLTDAFHRTPVMRLYQFFRDYRQSLRQLARHAGDPRVAVLTPGPANETYFEQAYLARYLGFPLVEGADLTTRDRQVYLRTVGGLRQIDVLLRRLDSEFCDPLELESSSLLGVPGLVHVAQGGRVALANQLGARALETTGLLAFLQPLAREVLGEDLLVPSVATWWCGQEKARRTVLGKLDTLVVKPTFAARGPAGATRYGALLSPAERASLAREIEARPWAYCGQERVFLGTTPAWSDQAGLTPVPYVLRVFLTWVDGDYHVLPGGLTRFNPSGADGIVSLQTGSVSKDTWVLQTTPSKEPLLTLTAPLAAAYRVAAATPSRVADELYWLGRYLERTSQIARLLEKLDPLLRDEIAVLDPGVASDAARLVLRAQDEWVPAGLPHEGLAARAHALAADPDRPGSLASNLGQISRILDLAKIHLPPEAWQVARRVRRPVEPGAILPAMSELRAQLASLDGTIAEALPRDTGWHFLELGRRLERAMQLLFALEAFLPPLEVVAPTEFRLQTLLHLTYGLFTYRSIYQSVYEPAPVLACLLGAADNPRSMRFQADRIEEHLKALPEELAPHAVEQLRTSAFRLLSRVRLVDTAALAADPAAPSAFARELQEELAALSDRLGEVYFAHVERTE